MRIYAAYGSNMNLEQMAQRCPDAKVIGVGVLEDYRLTFRGTYRGVANIEPCKGKQVPIVLWEITPICEEELDIYEGYPRLYEKNNIHVKTEQGVQKAMAYVMTKHYKDKPALPMSYYLNTIKEGYKDNGIDEAPLKQAHLECIKELR